MHLKRLSLSEGSVILVIELGMLKNQAYYFVMMHMGVFALVPLPYLPIYLQLYTGVCKQCFLWTISLS